MGEQIGGWFCPDSGRDSSPKHNYKLIFTSTEFKGETRVDSFCCDSETQRFTRLLVTCEASTFL